MAKQAIQQGITDNDLDRTVVLPTTLFGEGGLPTDAWRIDEAGVPVISMISAPVYLYDPPTHATWSPATSWQRSRRPSSRSSSVSIT